MFLNCLLKNSFFLQHVKLSRRYMPKKTTQNNPIKFCNDRFGIVFGSCLDGFWIVFERFLDSFWIVFGSFLDRFWIVFGWFLDSFWIVFE